MKHNYIPDCPEAFLWAEVEDGIKVPAMPAAWITLQFLHKFAASLWWKSAAGLPMNLESRS